MSYYASPDVIVTDLDREIILLDPRNGEMFALNATGRCIWLSLPARSLEQISRAVTTTFADSPPFACADAEAFMMELTRNGLVIDAIDD